MTGYGENNATASAPMMEYENLYMVIRIGNNLSYNKSPYLYLDANAENESAATSIRWRARSVSMGFGYEVFLTGFVLYTGKDVINQPAHRVLETKSLIPDKSNPEQLTSHSVVDHFWESTVLRTGSVAYYFYLAFVDHTGRVRG